jgi:hypothetical protein
MRLRYTLLPDWPRLAWLARLSPGAAIEILHGADVALAEEWFCEAVWDGAYAAGDFDRTDVVFGSGGRIRAHALTFVSSGATVDRLQSLAYDGTTWVSNSLVCLLAHSGATVDPIYPGYFGDFKEITAGIERPAPELLTSMGPVRFTYYHNLVWDGRSLLEAAKPRPPRRFRSFDGYRAFLDASLQQLCENASAPTRRFRFEPVGTISSGYDSGTVAALARASGLREAIGFDCVESDDRDSGAAIAAALGIRLDVVARDAWRAMPQSEVPFIAADAKGEDVYFSGAQAKLRHRLLLTGFHGDSVWRSTGPARRGTLARGDQSGLSLTEYRLWTGFVHCPVPFMGACNSEEITAISRSSAMAPWATGEHGYSRPICRRVLEEAGVPRELFGQSKKAASVLFFRRHEHLSDASRVDYELWLDHHGLAAPRQGVRRVATAFRALLPGSPRDHAFRHLFPWALARATQRYIAAAPLLDIEYALP